MTLNGYFISNSVFVPANKNIAATTSVRLSQLIAI